MNNKSLYSVEIVKKEEHVSVFVGDIIREAKKSDKDQMLPEIEPNWVLAETKKQAIEIAKEYADVYNQLETFEMDDEPDYNNLARETENDNYYLSRM